MKHKFAIIGLGIMGRRMLENVLRHPDFEVCGLWDPSADSVAKARIIYRTHPLRKAPKQPCTKRMWCTWLVPPGLAKPTH